MSHEFREPTCNADEAAKYLIINKDTLLRRVRAGLIPASKIGRSWVFLESDLSQYIKNNKWQSQNDPDLNITSADLKSAAASLDDQLGPVIDDRRNSLKLISGGRSCEGSRQAKRQRLKTVS